MNQNLKVLQAFTDGHVLSQLRVQSHHLNRYNTLHGGMIGYLIDVCGSASIAAKRQHLMTGVTTDLNMTCIRAAKPGDLLTIHSQSEKVGRNVVFSSVNLYVFPDEVTTIDQLQGKQDLQEFLIAGGRHTKFISNRHIDAKLWFMLNIFCGLIILLSDILVGLSFLECNRCNLTALVAIMI